MKSKINFLEGNVSKNLLKMVFPLLAAMILTMAYNLVDSIWVGNLLGESGYAALTNSTAVVLILSAIAMGASNGISILVSQKIGAGKISEANSIISTILVVSTLFSIIVTVVLELLLKPILTMMNTPPELFDMAYQYLSIYLLGYVSIFIYMHFTAVFRSYGDPMFQMKGMLAGTVLNAFIDPVMIHMIGLKGAAWATVISEIVCLIYAIIYWARKKQFKVCFKDVSLKNLKVIMQDAIPSAIQQCIPAISSATMLYLVTGFGVTTIAAYGVTSKLEILLFYPAMAMNMGLTTIIGQCYGAHRIDKAKEYMKCSLKTGGIFISIISIIVIAFCGKLSWLFVQSVEASQIVKSFFLVVSVGYLMYMITSCFLGELSGFGKPGMSMLLFAVYYLAVRIPLAFLFVRTPLGLNGIWVAILVSHIVAAILATISGISAFSSKKKLSIVSIA